MSKTKRISLLLLVCLSTLASAQQYLYIKKKGELPAERLKVGDPVKLRTADGEDWIKGNIQKIAVKSITFNNQVYPLKNVAGIRTYNSLVKITGTALWVGGTLFTGIALTNRLINDDRPVLFPGQIIFGAAMVSGGLLVNWLSRNTYKTSNGYYWEVIDLNKEYIE